MTPQELHGTLTSCLEARLAVFKFFGSDAEAQFDYGLVDVTTHYWAILPGPEMDVVVHGKELPAGGWSHEDDTVPWEETALVTEGVLVGHDYTMVLAQSGGGLTKTYEALVLSNSKRVGPPPPPREEDMDDPEAVCPKCLREYSDHPCFPVPPGDPVKRILCNGKVVNE